MTDFSEYQRRARTTAVYPGQHTFLGLAYASLGLAGRRHHSAHHARSHPVPWTVLEQHAPKVFQFARELGLVWWLELNYPAGPVDPTWKDAA